MTPKPRRRVWTDRDELCMRFVAEQWVMDLDTVAMLCGTSRTRTYELIGRWRDDFKTVHSDSVAHGNSGARVTVVWPTNATAAERLGRAVPAWSPTRTNLVHKVECSRVRAALCGLDMGVWTPERTLLRRAAIAAGRGIGTGVKPGFAAPHVHDGHYTTGDGTVLAVEVELTLKRPNRTRVAATVEAAWRARPAGGGLLYVCGDDQIFGAVKRAVEQLIAAGRIPPKPDIRLRDLGEVTQSRSIAKSPKHIDRKELNP